MDKDIVKSVTGLGQLFEQRACPLLKKASKTVIVTSTVNKAREDEFVGVWYFLSVRSVGTNSNETAEFDN